MPKVSVVMPMLNSIAFLRECMDSVVNQTLQGIEILPVDGGSTDGTLECLAEYARRDARIRIIHSEKKSWGAQCNRGIEAASGDYIAFLESDDKMLPDMLEKLYQAVVAYDADLVKANYYEFHTDNAWKREMDLTQSFPIGEVFCARDMDGVFAKPDMWAQVWDGLYRSDYMKKPEMAANETPGASYQDMSFSFRMWYNADRIVCIPDPVICYRTDNPNSSVKSPKKVFCIMEEFAYIDRWLERYASGDKCVSAQIRPVQFLHYQANLERVADIYSYAFLMRMHLDFDLAANKGCLKREYWDEKSWNQVNLLLENPDAYFEQYGGAYLRSFVFPDCSVNQDVYKQAVCERMRSAEELVIYGAGFYGRQLVDKIRPIRTPDVFIVSDTTGNPADIEGIPVISVEEMQRRWQHPFVVVGVMHPPVQREIAESLRGMGVEDVWIPDL